MAEKLRRPGPAGHDVSLALAFPERPAEMAARVRDRASPTALSARPALRRPRVRCTSDAMFMLRPATLRTAWTLAMRRSSPIRSRQFDVPVAAAGSALAIPSASAL
jgi:hypothetical protein